MEKNNFWENCANKSKEEIFDELSIILGKPKTETEQACLRNISKKISSYYGETKENGISSRVYMMAGVVGEISERKFKDGRNVGKNYFELQLSEPTKLNLLAWPSFLEEKKWQQIQNLVIKGQNLVFKYRNWKTNKLVIDFYPQENNV